MNRASRRRVLGHEFKASQEAKRLERRALTLTQAQARELLARWASQPGRTQEQIDEINRKLAR
jgi:hypothetical protein